MKHSAKMGQLPESHTQFAKVGLYASINVNL